MNFEIIDSSLGMTRFVLSMTMHDNNHGDLVIMLVRVIKVEVAQDQVQTAVRRSDVTSSGDLRMSHAIRQRQELMLLFLLALC